MTQQFSLDRSVFEELSLVKGSTERCNFFDDNYPSGQQRLFFQVWASQALQVGVFGSVYALTKAGEVPVYGYVVTSGEARRIPLDQNAEEVVLGPGSALVVAEGLAGIPALHTAEALSSVNCKDIPIDMAAAETGRLNPGMKGICRFTLGRILNSPMEKEPAWLQ